MRLDEFLRSHQCTALSRQPNDEGNAQDFAIEGVLHRSNLAVLPKGIAARRCESEERVFRHSMFISRIEERAEAEVHYGHLAGKGVDIPQQFIGIEAALSLDVRRRGEFAGLRVIFVAEGI